MYDDDNTRVTDDGVRANAGDVISVILDADAWTVSFRKNDNEAIGTVKIKRGEYRIAVSMFHEGDSVSFV